MRSVVPPLLDVTPILVEETEDARLKKLVADQALDNAILKEVSQGKF